MLATMGTASVLADGSTPRISTASENGVPAVSTSSRRQRRWLPRDRPLPWLLLLATILRIWAASTPGFHHPDAIYQYLEPAHRLLTGDGVITWEWRTGIRSWMLPALLAIPLGIGDALDPNGSLPMILPRIATALASLGIVWAAWDIGRRHAPLTGVLAAFVMATWFETIFFAAETLAEPIAVAAIMPAAALATGPRITLVKSVAIGALAGFASLARPHYAPAAGVLLLIAWWPTLRPSTFSAHRWIALAIGAALVALASAAIDASQGLTPFAWILGNFEQNIVHNVSARYGTFPLLSYVAWFMEMWGWWMIPAVVGILFGWRQCPGLLAAAAVVIAIHSVIPHKEYRFVFLAFTALTLLSALGWGQIIVLARRRLGARRGTGVAIATFVMWGMASVALAQGLMAPNQLKPHADGVAVAGALRRDPAVCGVAFVQPNQLCRYARHRRSSSRHPGQRVLGG